jgi:hypothetical protein
LASAKIGGEMSCHKRKYCLVTSGYDSSTPHRAKVLASYDWILDVQRKLHFWQGVVLS